MTAERAGYWPQHVQIVGPWRKQGAEAERAAHAEPAASGSAPLPEAIAAFLAHRDERDRAPLLASFGSMVPLGLVAPISTLLRTLHATASLSRRRMLVVCDAVAGEDAARACAEVLGTASAAPSSSLPAPSASCSPAGAIPVRPCRAAAPSLPGWQGVTADGRLGVWVGDVPLDIVASLCSGVISHGGSGTTTAVASAGVPHVVCPFIFDQFRWAERVQALGIGDGSLRPQHLGLSAVQKTVAKQSNGGGGAGSGGDAAEPPHLPAILRALRCVDDAAVRGRCKEMADEFRRESGTQPAVAALRAAHERAQHRALRQLPRTSTPPAPPALEAPGLSLAAGVRLWRPPRAEAAELEFIAQEVLRDDCYFKVSVPATAARAARSP